jgi:hypothetical protein
MFFDNKYTKIYYSIINRALLRTEDVAGEIHHIIPKSMGGVNRKSNYVKLTYKEHYICHLLLTKMVIDPTHKMYMFFALRSFGRQSRNFVYFKEQIALAYKNMNKGVKKSEETKIKMRGKRPHINQTGINNNAFKGFIITPFGTFESLKEAASVENVHYSTIAYRLHNEKFSEYRRVA